MRFNAETLRRREKHREDERGASREEEGHDWRPAASALGPVAGLGLDYEAFGFRGELQAAEAGDADRNVGDEAQVVLAAEFLLNGLEDLLDAEVPRHLKAAPAGFARDPLE